MRIIFAGTPDIAAGVLESILTFCSSSGDANNQFEVVACLTQPDRKQGRGQKLQFSPVKEIAIKYSVPVLQPHTLKDVEIQEQLTQFKPDVMIVLAYGLILPKKILDIPTHGCINIHASILPRWRGAAPIQYAILHNDKTSGVTIMQMDVGLDDGDIISIHPTNIEKDETSSTLLNKIENISKKAIAQCLVSISTSTITRTPQEHSKATYAHKIKKDDAKIDWGKSAVEIDCLIRAYNPWPIAFTTFNNEIVRIWKSVLVNTTHNLTQPGSIVSIDKTGVVVATSSPDQCIKLEVMQFPGKKALPISDILNSRKDLLVGSKFI